MLQRVVAVVIAEGPLGSALARRDAADERELRVRDERMRSLAVHLRQPLAGDQRGQHQLRHVLGQRRDRGQDQRRRAAEEHGHRQRLAARFGDRVVKAAALADLPVHAGRARVVDLQAIHAEVVAAAIGMRRCRRAAA